MNILVLTQDTGKILGPIAKYILGPILNAIFVVLDKIGIPNVGLSIILFTIVVYLLMMPLTIKQQKFSKLQAKMQPEIQAIQKKYKDKKDQDSQMAMNQETQAVYAKYGVSPTGSCVQLLIQMPILFALYRVIYLIPAYVTKIGNTFRVLADQIVANDNGNFIISATNENMSSVFKAYSMYKKNYDLDATKGIIDILNKTSTTDIQTISEHYNLSNLTYEGNRIISSVGSNGKVIARGLIDTYNNFLGINIGNTPSETVRTAFSNGQYLLVIGAIMIPVLAAVTQWLNVKLTPQASSQPSGNEQQDQMQSSMKAMNTFMPLFSAFMCFTLPAGLGIYWVAGAVVRSIQQVAINKYIDKMDLEEEIKKNVEKRNNRLKKAGIDPNIINANANRSTKSVSSITKESTARINNVSNDGTKKSGGSLAAKANMVRDYNERNNK